jgi:hypothetical protein
VVHGQHAFWRNNGGSLPGVIKSEHEPTFSRASCPRKSQKQLARGDIEHTQSLEAAAYRHSRTIAAKRQRLDKPTVVFCGSGDAPNLSGASCVVEARDVIPVGHGDARTVAIGGDGIAAFYDLQPQWAAIVPDLVDGDSVCREEHPSLAIPCQSNVVVQIPTPRRWPRQCDWECAVRKYPHCEAPSSAYARERRAAG